MPKLILQFEDHVLKDCSLGLIATIGRLPDNTVIIDNPAVSGHHACVFRDGNDFVVEDLDSTNGTFVNEQRVTRHPLRDGDVMQIGKHKLVFDQTASVDAVAPDEAKPGMATLRDTVFLDTEKHKMLLARLTGVPVDATLPLNGRAAPAKVATLRVVAGRTDQQEYTLTAHTSLIGKGAASVVRLKGWFKPSVAAAITRNGHGYVVTALNGSTRINRQPLKGRRDLQDGDVLRVSGLTLEFRLK